MYLFYFKQGDFSDPVKGFFPKNIPRVNMTCVKCLSNRETSFITGGVNGDLFLWKNTNLIFTVKAFDMPILAMYIHLDKLYASGAVESRLKVYSVPDLQELQGLTQRFEDEIKAITVSDNLEIVVSLGQGSIIIRQPQGDKKLIQTHECGELWTFDVDKTTGLVSAKDIRFFIYLKCIFFRLML